MDTAILAIIVVGAIIALNFAIPYFGKKKVDSSYEEPSEQSMKSVLTDIIPVFQSIATRAMAILSIDPNNYTKDQYLDLLANEILVTFNSEIEKSTIDAIENNKVILTAIPDEYKLKFIRNKVLSMPSISRTINEFYSKDNPDEAVEVIDEKTEEKSEEDEIIDAKKETSTKPESVNITEAINDFYED